MKSILRPKCSLVPGSESIVQITQRGRSLGQTITRTSNAGHTINTLRSISTHEKCPSLIITSRLVQAEGLLEMQVSIKRLVVSVPRISLDSPCKGPLRKIYTRGRIDLIQSTCGEKGYKPRDLIMVWVV